MFVAGCIMIFILSIAYFNIICVIYDKMERNNLKYIKFRAQVPIIALNK